MLASVSRKMEMSNGLMVSICCYLVGISPHSVKSPVLNAPLVLVKPLPADSAHTSGEAAWHPMGPLQALGSFSIQSLESAINRARQQQPAQEHGASLTPDVSKLAALYGWMIFKGLQEVSPDLLNADELEAVTRWI